MPNGDPREGFFFPTLTLLIDSYNLSAGFKFHFIRFQFMKFLDDLNASSDFCHQLTTFANSLDPDQDSQYLSVGPELGPNCLTLR